MYKDKLEIEIAKALSGNSHLDYDVAMLVAKELIHLEEKESERKARAYYCRRKGDIPKELRKKLGIHFRKEKFGVPELPTPIIFMKELYNKDGCGYMYSPPHAEYCKLYDYTKVLQYFTTVGVRDMKCRPHGTDEAIPKYPSVVLSAWDIVPKVQDERNSLPDNIKELASHMGKLPYNELLKSTNFVRRRTHPKVYDCWMYLDRY